MVQDLGNPLIEIYSSRKYKAAASNWSIIQDKRGVMYFGNGAGILEFDGSSWRKIEVPRSQTVRRFAKSTEGTIYCTVSSDIGYLGPDSIGLMKFNSIIPSFGDQYQQKDEIWDVATNSEGIFFKTNNKIYRWSNGEMTVWDSIDAFRFYKIGDSIYSRNNGVGLMEIDGDSVKLIQGGEYFSSIGVFDMLPLYGKDSNHLDNILITTNGDGAFIYNGKTVSQFITEVDDYLKNNQIYNTCVLKDGNIAFATQRGGVVIVNNKGKLIKIINEKSGLLSNITYDVYSDRQGGLWIATEQGIAHVEISAPFLIISAEHYFNNSIAAILRFENRIYAVNSLGVLYMNNDGSSFKLIKGSNKPGYSLFNENGTLIAATNGGLFSIQKDSFSKKLTDRSSQKLYSSKFFPNRIYVCHRGGVTILKQNQNEFEIFPTSIEYEEIYTLVEESKQSLWLRSEHGVIIHITGDLRSLDSGSDEGIKFEYFDDNTGFRPESWEIHDINDRMLLTTDNGTYTYSSSSNSFVHDSTLGNLLSDSTTTITFIAEGINNNLWVLANVNGENELGQAVLKEDGNYTWNPDPRLKRLDLNTFSTLYVDHNSLSNKDIVWICTNEGLAIFDPDKKNNLSTNFRTLIRKVSVNNDSLIYGGTENEHLLTISTILPFSKNDISFYVSAVNFDNPEKTLYQYFLDGYDTVWSNWTTETRKEYTNLSNGDYQLRVRSKSIYGIIGQEDTFSFSISPPWYSTWWAYVIYGCVFLTGLFVIDKIMRKTIINKELEQAKLRETKLIKEQAEELETVDRLVRTINSADNLESLFNSLLDQTIRVIPQAEKAGVFLLNHKINLFRLAYTSGYDVEDIKNITFTLKELEQRYTNNSKEIEKGIYLIDDTCQIADNEKFSSFNTPKSMLVMVVQWDNAIEAFIVFDSFADKHTFNESAARILKKFHEHVVSAINKAQSVKTLQEKNDEIIKTQEQLITQEKLASLGQLTAGIAHEIKNPLNFVNNFAEVSIELSKELREYLENQRNNIDSEKWAEIEETIRIIVNNAQRINEHGQRADSIVSSMLQHSRGKSGDRRETDINAMLEENINLAFHGLRAQDSSFNITINKDFDNTIEKIEVVPQDLSRVFLNIILNGFHAAHKHRNKSIGGKDEPTIWIKTKSHKNIIEIRIRDNGSGIPKTIRNEIFKPFFTTKPTGEGTGLGLSIAHDIVVKEYGGKINVETKSGAFTEFIIQLPKNIER